MAQIKTEEQYKAACDRINELLKVVSNETPAGDKNLLELDFISDLVADYEELHFPILRSTALLTIASISSSVAFWIKTAFSVVYILSFIGFSMQIYAILF